MSETKFTPGPWWNGKDSNGNPVVLSSEATEYHTPDEEALANRRLCDAAPELYEALANIENDDGRIPQKIWDMRNKALAKARGETND